MKTIIAATDFSAAASNAVNYAADMAMFIGADLLLFYSYEVPVAYGEIPVIADPKALQHTAEADMNELQANLSERSGKRLRVNAAVRVGSFFHELKTVCENVHPYAVVMGSQGTTAVERFFFGTHAVYAMQHLTWPLITVPPNALFSSIRKIALACDFENVVSSTPINEIKRLVNDFNATLHVINSGKKDSYNADEVFGSRMLEELLSPVKPEFHFLADGNTDENIIHFTDTNNIDLLVVLPRRHGIIQKITHKSHTGQLVLHGHVPVIALHENEV